MNNILDILLADENRAALSEVQKNFNLSENEARAAVEELIPALSRGLQKNTRSEPGMDDLLDALRTGKHERYMEKPDTLGSAETTRDGNDILGHIFGNKEVSREVANRVSKKSGLSSTVLKKMLPVVASLVMGALSKKVIGGVQGGAASSRSGQGGLLTSLLDGDRDGSVWDDVLGMAARTMFR
ncbi:MAG: DUF937 domain-containing protein [Granulosicoccus sp.]|nr:DUF937 domain-containing protein [Granulosicoccus sp.]